MRLIVGYDREFATQCFKRNLRQLIRPDGESVNRISPAEVDYFSERLAETSVFGCADRFGNPWISRDDATKLARRSSRKASRAELQRCEMVANNVLILEGIVGRAGALKAMTYEQGKVLWKRGETAEMLYRKASLGAFRSAAEKAVLQGMSRHVFDWIRYLSFLPGNDFMDLLSGMRSHQLHLPS